MSTLDSSIPLGVRVAAPPDFLGAAQRRSALAGQQMQNTAAQQALADADQSRADADALKALLAKHVHAAPTGGSTLDKAGFLADLETVAPEKAATLRQAWAKEAPPYRAPHVVGRALVTDDGTVTYRDPETPRPRLVVDPGTGEVVEMVPGARLHPKPVSHGGTATPKEPRGLFVETTDGLMLGNPVTGEVRPAVGPGGQPVYKPQSGEGGKIGGMVDEGLRALDDIDTAWSDLGGKGGVAGFLEQGKTLLPGGGGDEDAQVFRSATANLSDVIGRMRSGGAINGGEFRTFRGFIPRPTDTPKNVRYKLDMMRRSLAGVQRRLGAAPSAAPAPRETMTPAGGHRVPQSWTTPATPQTMTMADVQTTAIASGKTVAQVVAAAKAKGIRVTR